MSHIALVEVVRILPPPRDALSLVALQLRCWKSFDFGCQHVHSFVVDSALSCTLSVGQWVAFEPVSRRESAPLRDVELLHEDHRFAHVLREPDPRSQMAHIDRMLAQHGVRAATPEAAHAESLEIHRKLNFLQVQFGASGFPAELLRGCFHEKAALDILPSLKEGDSSLRRLEFLLHRGLPPKA